MLNEIIKVAIPFAIALTFVYLLGSFVAVSFDPAAWSDSSRIVAVFWGCAFGYALYRKINYVF